MCNPIILIRYSCFLLKGVRQKRPIMDNNENGNAAFSECRSEVVDFQAGLLESFCGVRTTRARTLPECALPDMRFPAHTSAFGNESTKQTHTAFFMAGSRKSSLFHLSCPCVRQSPRILYEGFKLRASSARAFP